jgi:hypothetical protein
MNETMTGAAVGRDAAHADEHEPDEDAEAEASDEEGSEADSDEGEQDDDAFKEWLQTEEEQLALLRQALAVVSSSTVCLHRATSTPFQSESVPARCSRRAPSHRRGCNTVRKRDRLRHGANGTDWLADQVGASSDGDALEALTVLDAVKKLANAEFSAAALKVRHTALHVRWRLKPVFRSGGLAAAVRHWLQAPGMLNALLVAASIATSDACGLTKQERKRLIKEANRLRRANKTPKHVRACTGRSLPTSAIPLTYQRNPASFHLVIRYLFALVSKQRACMEAPRSKQKRKVKQGAKKTKK